MERRTHTLRRGARSSLNLRRVPFFFGLAWFLGACGFSSSRALEPAVAPSGPEAFARVGERGSGQSAAKPIAPVIVAVFDVEDATGRFDEPLRGQLTDYLAAAFGRLPGVAVVPRASVADALAKSKAESYRACFDERCQIELGKALSAQRSLATKILGVGQFCALTAALFDLRTETTARAATQKAACRAEAMFAALDALVAQLAGEGRGPALLPDETQWLQLPKDVDDDSSEPPLELVLPSAPSSGVTERDSTVSDHRSGGEDARPETGAEEEATPEALIVRWSLRGGRRILVLPRPLGFNENEESLSASARGLLDALATTILRDARLSGMRLALVGHADAHERGRLELSERRARSVRAYLLGRGVPVSHLVLLAVGDREPLTAATSQQARASNRRVEIEKPRDE